jgi:hypothetical protein
MTFRTITEAEARVILADEEAGMLPFQFVNSDGINEIHGFLAQNHKSGGDHFTPDMMRAWTAEAEFQLGEGNPASIEIRSWDSISGHTVTFTVSDAGLSWGICA